MRPLLRSDAEKCIKLKWLIERKNNKTNTFAKHDIVCNSNLLLLVLLVLLVLLYDGCTLINWSIRHRAAINQLKLSATVALAAGC